jgi:hypothetical protein
VTDTETVEVTVTHDDDVDVAKLVAVLVGVTDDDAVTEHVAELVDVAVVVTVAAFEVVNVVEIDAKPDVVTRGVIVLDTVAVREFSALMDAVAQLVIEGVGDTDDDLDGEEDDDGDLEENVVRDSTAEAVLSAVPENETDAVGLTPPENEARPEADTDGDKEDDRFIVLVASALLDTVNDPFKLLVVDVEYDADADAVDVADCEPLRLPS